MLEMFQNKKVVKINQCNKYTQMLKCPFSMGEYMVCKLHLNTAVKKKQKTNSIKAVITQKIK